MKTIHKVQLPNALNNVSVPKGARFIHVEEQNCELTAWYQCDTDQPKEMRLLHIVGTGNAIPDGKMSHIGTAIMTPFVFHVFEEVK